MLRKWYVNTFVILLVVEALSWLAYAYPSLTLPLLLTVLTVTFAIACYRLDYGIAVVLAELAVGSQGHLLGQLRLGLFAVVLLATFIVIIRQRRVILLQTMYWKWYLAIVCVLGMAGITGWLYGNNLSNLFLDANGYLFIAMVVPFTQAIRTQQQIQELAMVLLAALSVLMLQTILILLLFSHPTAFVYYLPELYRWLRDFRLAEITMQANHFTRIFFQSHIYVLFAFILASGAILLNHHRRWMTVLLGMASTLLFISYSRSFWVASFIITLGFLWKGKWNYLWRLLLGFVVGFAVVVGVINLPLLGQGSGVDVADLLTDRTDDLTTDVGGGSRLALLRPLAVATLAHPLIGSGFGTTVTYTALDQRSIEAGHNGLYTTFAFEWGYLDLLLKLGWFGSSIVISVVLAIAIRLFWLYRQEQTVLDRVVLLTAGVGVMAVLMVHTLTPYLNHPLGIGWIVFATAIVHVYDQATH